MKLKLKYKKNTKWLAASIATASMSLLCNQAVIAEVDVDTELLLLVDISGSVDATEYGLMMQGYADAFRNTDIITALDNGPKGSIAVSLMFWSANDQQAVGVDWMKIDDQSSSNSFADAIELTTRPFSSITAIGSALTAGTQSFGLETGGTEGNGFNSTVQIIDISGDGEDNDTPPAGDRALNVRVARDAAIQSGIDMINALTIGNAGGNLEQYYKDNVIAGSAGGVEAFTQPAVDFGSVEESLTVKLSREVSAGGVAASAVPEASTAALLGGTLLLFTLQRRR